MKTIKTKLFGTSNAVLTDAEDGNVIAIIKCGKKENITKKVQKAIAEHFSADSFETEKGCLELEHSPIYFDSEHVEDEMNTARSFKLAVVVTY